MPGNHYILHMRCARRNQRSTQRPHTHPGAGGEFEIFGHTAIKHQTFGGVVRVGKLEGVAHQVEAFFVKGCCRQHRVLPVAGRDVGAAHAHLQLGIRRRVSRHELDFLPRYRQADVAGALHHPVGEQHRRRSLGRAERGNHRNPLAAGFDTQAVQFVPHMLRQASPGVEQQLDLAEEVLAQLLVGFEKRQQRLIPLGHIQIHGGRNLFEIGHSFFDQPRQWFAVVDVQGAAVIQHAIKIVVTAEGVVPGRPVEEHRRRIAQKRQRMHDLALVAGEHALSVDDTFGAAGRAGGE